MVTGFMGLFEYFIYVFNSSFMIYIKSILDALDELIEIDLSIFVFV